MQAVSPCKSLVARIDRVAAAFSLRARRSMLQNRAASWSTRRAMLPPRYLLVVLDQPRQAVDGRLQHMARRRGWHFVKLRRGAFARARALLPRGTAIVVAATLPRAGEDALLSAFAALRRNDMVFGPDDDGLYWLVGWSRRRRVPPAMFSPALDEALAPMPANFWVELLPSETYPPLKL
jgi:glycosyltransferase A (GT-A) superfamily protein (DUF2064 family)